MTSAHDDAGERFAVARDYIRTRGEIPIDAHGQEVDTQWRRFAKLGGVVVAGRGDAALGVQLVNIAPRGRRVGTAHR